MWTAVSFSLIEFLMQFGTCYGVCCCSRRKWAVSKSQSISSSVSDGNENGNGHGNRILEKENVSPTAVATRKGGLVRRVNEELPFGGA
jgi:hypothetical protein